MALYSDNRALVGVIAAGNGNSERSNDSIILDSPEPPDEIPSSRRPLSPKEVLGRFESIVASGTPGNDPVSENTEPSYKVIELFPAPSSVPNRPGTRNELTSDQEPNRWSCSALTLQNSQKSPEVILSGVVYARFE